MLEELRQWIGSFFVEHGKGKIGLLLGLLVGIAVLVFGFWKTAFVLLCGCIGHYIGMKMEREEDWVQRVLSSLQNRLPDKFQNWL
jgi:uncharacterized membrane protein